MHVTSGGGSRTSRFSRNYSSKSDRTKSRSRKSSSSSSKKSNESSSYQRSSSSKKPKSSSKASGNVSRTSYSSSSKKSSKTYSSKSMSRSRRSLNRRINDPKKRDDFRMGSEKKIEKRVDDKRKERARRKERERRRRRKREREREKEKRVENSKIPVKSSSEIKRPAGKGNLEIKDPVKKVINRPDNRGNLEIRSSTKPNSSANTSRPSNANLNSQTYGLGSREGDDYYIKVGKTTTTYADIGAATDFHVVNGQINNLGIKEANIDLSGSVGRFYGGMTHEGQGAFKGEERISGYVAGLEGQVNIDVEVFDKKITLGLAPSALSIGGHLKLGSSYYDDNSEYHDFNIELGGALGIGAIAEFDVVDLKKTKELNDKKNP